MNTYKIDRLLFTQTFNKICSESSLWIAVKKSNLVALDMANNHYTRQSPESNMWTRPGYNLVMLHSSGNGIALWCWWRPKWESGIPGTERKDKLRVLECTMFRREGRLNRMSSELIIDAVKFLDSDIARMSLHLDCAGSIDMLITGVDTKKTTSARSPKSLGGMCYRHAGWMPLEKRVGKADIWLYYPWENK